MRHAKTDSDVTSLEASSPGRSPHRAPVYYVQSPSHDGEKSAASFHSSPAASPRHSSSLGTHHSRGSSSTHYSASLKNKVSPGDHRKVSRPHAIEEEGLLDDDDDYPRSLPRRCYYLGFLLAFLLLFGFFSLVLLGVSRGQKPHITMKTMSFSYLQVQAGTDYTGVPTDMMNLNSTVSLVFKNTATFFGLHVTSTPLDLLFTEISLADGNMEYFYQRRNSQRNVNVTVIGYRVPLYGSGSYLTVTPGKAAAVPPVPLTLQFTVRSRGYVLGKLVKPKFYIHVNCTVPVDLNKITKPIPLENRCEFHR